MSDLAIGILIGVVSWPTGLLALFLWAVLVPPRPYLDEPADEQQWAADADFKRWSKEMHSHE